MRLSYDFEADALTVSFRDTTVTTKDLAEGIVGVFDAEGHLVGLEILDATSRFGDASTLREVTLTGLGLGAPAAAERSSVSASRSDAA